MKCRAGNDLASWHCNRRNTYKRHLSQVASFAVEYSTNEEFSVNTTVRVEGLTSFFLSDRSNDANVMDGVYETDITGLQVT